MYRHEVEVVVSEPFDRPTLQLFAVAVLQDVVAVVSTAVACDWRLKRKPLDSTKVYIQMLSYSQQVNFELWTSLDWRVA